MRFPEPLTRLAGRLGPNVKFGAAAAAGVGVLSAAVVAWTSHVDSVHQRQLEGTNVFDVRPSASSRSASARPGVQSDFGYSGSRMDVVKPVGWTFGSQAPAGPGGDQRGGNLQSILQGMPQGNNFEQGGFPPPPGAPKGGPPSPPGNVAGSGGPQSRELKPLGTPSIRNGGANGSGSGPSYNYSTTQSAPSETSERGAAAAAAGFSETTGDSAGSRGGATLWSRLTGAIGRRMGALAAAIGRGLGTGTRVVSAPNAGGGAPSSDIDGETQDLSSQQNGGAKVGDSGEKKKHSFDDQITPPPLNIGPGYNSGDENLGDNNNKDKHPKQTTLTDLGGDNNGGGNLGGNNNGDGKDKNPTQTTPTPTVTDTGGNNKGDNKDKPPTQTTPTPPGPDQTTQTGNYMLSADAKNCLNGNGPCTYKCISGDCNKVNHCGSDEIPMSTKDGNLVCTPTDGNVQAGKDISTVYYTLSHNPDSPYQIVAPCDQPGRSPVVAKINGKVVYAMMCPPESSSPQKPSNSTAKIFSTLTTPTNGCDGIENCDPTTGLVNINTSIAPPNPVAGNQNKLTNLFLQEGQSMAGNAPASKCASLANALQSARNAADYLQKASPGSASAKRYAATVSQLQQQYAACMGR